VVVVVMVVVVVRSVKSFSNHQVRARLAAK
jgi:hypothetical protein